MALTTKVIDGDLLTLRIVFPDDRTVTVTAGRDGKSVGVAPNDGKIADRLSSIFHWSTEKVGEPGYPFTSLNQVIYGMETLARSAMSVEQFIAGLREVLEVSGTSSEPEIGIRTPSYDRRRPEPERERMVCRCPLPDRRALQAGHQQGQHWLGRRPAGTRAR